MAPNIQAAAQTARQADVAIVFARTYESEGFIDRPNLQLPYDQGQLIREVARRNRRTVVVLQTGGPVTTAEWDRRVPAILENWFGGEEQGHAIADVLWGDVNPSGSLPVTFPRSDQPDADHLPRRPAAIPRGQRPDAVPGGRIHRLPRLPEVRPGTELAVRVGALLHVVPVLRPPGPPRAADAGNR